MSALRTYWHLAHLGHKPSPYEIASSELLYHARRGFEIRTPVSAWIERHQLRGELRCRDWERFRDPRATTYARYVALQRDKEVFVDKLFAAAELDGGAAATHSDWQRTVEQLLAPLRYPLHGLQMVAAYVGALAPSGKIAIAAAFQAADEVRRIQRLTQHLWLRGARGRLGAEAKASWVDAPHWQPLRELIERLLVTYEWGEALVVLDGLVKPCLDVLFMRDLAELARACHDDGLHKLLHSLHEDCLWHAQWSGALLSLLASESQANRRLLEVWFLRWRPRVSAALQALLPVLEQGAACAACEPGFVPGQRLSDQLRAVPEWLAQTADSASCEGERP